MKVNIIEAIFRMGKPMSATELRKSFGFDDRPLSAVSYHVRKLEEMGIVRETGEPRKVRGALETFFSISPALLLPFDPTELARLDPRRREVLEMRFGLALDDPICHTLSDVADRLGVTRERVRQLQLTAITELGRKSS